MTDTLTEIQELFREIFFDPGLSIGPATTLKTIPGWNTMRHLQLMTALETHFGIVFSMEEIQAAERVDDLVRLVDLKRLS